MHYNYNADRPQATDRAGNPALRKNYYKWKNGECSIRVRKVPSSVGKSTIVNINHKVMYLYNFT